MIIYFLTTDKLGRSSCVSNLNFAKQNQNDSLLICIAVYDASLELRNCSTLGEIHQLQVMLMNLIKCILRNLFESRLGSE